MRTRSIVSIAVLGFLFSLTVGSQVNDAHAQGIVKSCTNVAASGADLGASAGYSYDAACLGGTTSAGTTVVAGTTSVAAANATAGLVLSRVSSFRASGSAPGKTADGGGTINLLGFGSGAAAGEKSASKFGLWVSGARTKVDGDATGAGFDTDSDSTMVGIDLRPVKEFMIGIAGGYEDSDTTTEFNRGNSDSDGRTAAAYVSISLSDQASIDAVGGYTWLEYDIDRLDPLSNAVISATDVDAKRWFGSLNLVGTWPLGASVDFGIKAGTMYVKEEIDGFTETGGANNVVVGASTVTVGTANAGLRLSGSHENVRPYIEGTYGYDYNEAGGTSYTGEHSYGGAAGFDISIGDSLSFNIEGRGVFKEDLKTTSGSATIRFQQEF